MDLLAPRSGDDVVLGRPFTKQKPSAAECGRLPSWTDGSWVELYMGVRGTVYRTRGDWLIFIEIY